MGRTAGPGGSPSSGSSRAAGGVGSCRGEPSGREPRPHFRARTPLFLHVTVSRTACTDYGGIETYSTTKAVFLSSWKQRGGLIQMLIAGPGSAPARETLLLPTAGKSALGCKKSAGFFQPDILLTRFVGDIPVGPGVQHARCVGFCRGGGVFTPKEAVTQRTWSLLSPHPYYLSQETPAGTCSHPERHPRAPVPVPGDTSMHLFPSQETSAHTCYTSQETPAGTCSCPERHPWAPVPRRHRASVTCPGRHPCIRQSPQFWSWWPPS